MLQHADSLDAYRGGAIGVKCPVQAATTRIQLVHGVQTLENWSTHSNCQQPTQFERLRRTVHIARRHATRTDGFRATSLECQHLPLGAV